VNDPSAFSVTLSPISLLSFSFKDNVSVSFIFIAISFSSDFFSLLSAVQFPAASGVVIGVSRLILSSLFITTLLPAFSCHVGYK
jgi:hypothetical protein